MLIPSILLTACGFENTEETPVFVKIVKEPIVVEEKKEEKKEKKKKEEQEEPIATSSLDPRLKETADVLISYMDAPKPYAEFPMLKSVDHTGTLPGPCYTKSQKKKFKKLCNKIEKERKVSNKEIRSSENSQKLFLHIHHVIDHDWRTRKGLLRVDTYGCWNETYGFWDIGKSAGDCQKSTWTMRKYQYKKDKKGMKYSASSSPKESLLMQEIKKQSLTVPEKMHCKVQEVEPLKKGKGKITCQPLLIENNSVGERVVRLTVELSEDRLDINKGDLVSINYANAPKKGIQLQLKDYNSRRPSAHMDNWTLYSESGGVSVVEANPACPSLEKQQPHICRFADKSSDPVSTYEGCMAVENIGKVTSLAKGWAKNKKISNRDAFMIKVTTSILGNDANNMWAYMTKANSESSTGKTTEAKTTLQTALSKTTDKKEIASIASSAKKMEFAELEQSAYQKGCDNGDKRACKKLPKPEETEE